MSSLRLHNLSWLLLSILAVALDQLSKAWIIEHIALYESMPMLPHLNIVHLHNTGAAFSMLAHAPAAVFIGLSAAVALWFIVWMLRHPYDHRLVAAAFALIGGGAIGNAIDRIRLGYVTDFIDFYVRDLQWGDWLSLREWHFAAFNVADSAITLGAALLIVDLLLETRRQRRTVAPAAGPGPMNSDSGQ